MELNPPRGRPEKDPEERRSELVHIRMRPSHKQVVKQEAKRRDTSMTLVVVRIGFEEMNPSGRLIPEPLVWRWLLDKASDYRRAAKDSAVSFPSHELSSYEMRGKMKEVKERREKRNALWREARNERREKTIGVRLKPNRLRWLEERAEEKNTSRSGLLRVRALEGIDRLDKMHATTQILEAYREEASTLHDKRSYHDMPEDKLRSKMLALASDIEDSLENLRERT
jgi:hypothetical protein